jgi:hypothetical protein
VNLDEIKAKARNFVLVGGELVNGIKVPPEQQAGVVVQQILKSADHNRLGEVS